MSKPRYHWWSYAKAIVRLYPELKREYDTLHDQRVTASIAGLPGSGNRSRSTENVALRQLPPARQREYNAVTKAIEQTKQMQSGKDRLAVINMVLWKGTHNIDGAAMQLYISEITAKRYHSDFIRLVGFCYGLEDETGGQYGLENGSY